MKDKMSKERNYPAPNVYRASYRDFRAIPGAPWVYWIPEGIRRLFREFPKLGEMAEPVVGLRTSDNFRFLRFWWEVVLERIAFDCRDRAEALATGQRWFPYMKGGAYRKWYGNQEYVVNWWNDGAEVAEAIMRAYPYLGRPWVGGINYYFREGVTWSRTTSSRISVRYMAHGFIFDTEAASLFYSRPLWILEVLNSRVAGTLVSVVNPTIHYQIGDIAALPLPRKQNKSNVARDAIQSAVVEAMLTEPTFDFIAPPRWDTGLDDLAAIQARLQELETQIDEEVYRLYGISEEDRAAIEAELAGGPQMAAEEDDEEGIAGADEDETEAAEAPITREELAKRWISYAVGIVMGRFRPGLPRDRRSHRRGPLGRAVFHPEDFAVGSLPVPSPEEFDALVAPAERFAYVDEEGGRHLFPREVEAALRDLAVPEGIAVVQAHHPLDLAGRVRQALALMWGEEAAEDIIAAVGGDLARYLERDFWRDHLQTYRYRPVYWLLQSPRRTLTVYLYHEKVTRDTLFVVKTEILEPARRLLETRLQEQEALAEAAAGRERQRARNEAEALQAALDDLAAFADALERVLRRGYEPDLDDGVLINLAPLYELVPWPRKKRVAGRSVSELEATWLALEAGEYDWAHMAMRYWPDRVREKAQNDRSLAIAHGLN